MVPQELSIWLTKRICLYEAESTFSIAAAIARTVFGILLP